MVLGKFCGLRKEFQIVFSLSLIWQLSWHMIMPLNPEVGSISFFHGDNSTSSHETLYVLKDYKFDAQYVIFQET